MYVRIQKEQNCIGEVVMAKCDFCEKDYVLYECEIKDKIGTRYRNICESCIEKTKQNGIVKVIKQCGEAAHNAGLENPVEGALYSIRGVRGRHIDVFDNKCIIKTKVTIGSLLTHNATDGTKTIYYADVVGVQFKEPGITIGYLQLETPGLTMNNAASNFFNENSFTFDTTVITTEKMREVAAYIEERVQEIKHPKQQPQTVAPAMPQISVADELLKFKQLLDMGALTQEEFDAKKKELLNL